MGAEIKNEIIDKLVLSITWSDVRHVRLHLQRFLHRIWFEKVQNKVVFSTWMRSRSWFLRANKLVSAQIFVYCLDVVNISHYWRCFSHSIAHLPHNYCSIKFLGGVHNSYLPNFQFLIRKSEQWKLCFISRTFFARGLNLLRV